MVGRSTPTYSILLRRRYSCRWFISKKAADRCDRNAGSKVGNDVHLQAVDDDEGNVAQKSDLNERGTNKNALLINRCMVQNQVWLGQSSNYVCSNERCTNIAANKTTAELDTKNNNAIYAAKRNKSITSYPAPTRAVPPASNNDLKSHLTYRISKHSVHSLNQLAVPSWMDLG